MEIKELPRNAVHTWLQAVRLPLTGFELVARRGQDSTEWPPALAFEQAEARVKEIVGGLINDEALLTEARLQKAKVSELQRAAQQDAVAERRKQEADAEYQQKQREARDKKAQVEREAAQREQQLEQQKQQRERQVAEQTAKREQANRKVEQARKDAVDKQAQAAEKRRLEAEADALAEKQRALQTKGQALDLDQAVETTKAIRKARR